MWDYSFAVQSTFILSLILVIYFSLPRLSIRVNRIFVDLLIIQSAVIFFDIVSSWADNEYETMAVSVLYLLNSIYFILFYARAYLAFVFTANVFKMDPFSGMLRALLLALPVDIGIILVCISPWTGIIYSIEAGGYHAGPMYDIIYFITYFYLAISFIVMLTHRKNVNKKRYWYSMLLFNALMLAGIITRRAFPMLLLMDSFCLMSIITAYLTFENPEFYLDLKGAVFNTNALKDYLEERNGKLAHRLLGVVIHNYYEMRDIYGGKQMDAGVTLISRYLTESFADCNVFYYRRGRFIIMGPSDLNFEKCIEKINSRFEQPWKDEDIELYLDTCYLTVDLVGEISSLDGFFNILISNFEKADRQDSKVPVAISGKQIENNEYEVSVKRALEAAVDEDKVEVFLQVLVDANTGKAVGAEALCRIRDLKGELIPPGVFIPIAEGNGRINQLGEQVFEKTCEFISKNDMSKLGISWINVNLSPMQFMKTDLAKRYESIIQKYGINPECIHLEITEEAMIDDVFLRRQMQAMQSRGFMFVLDDYGTGYSNLTRLKKCSFINVKFDMSIVRDYCSEPDEIIPNMIQTFKHMKFGITAEGVETADMVKLLKEAGCDYLQGYYYSKPLPMDEFVQKYTIT
ncbi:EAL domain-containing protein [Butyrivibrio sp. FCS014]|uniref:EAL domain-containing protein n=1 Tax=Butyrivibrio sp. FCS014 TaxID=1408304 RepID=UPI0004667E6C|nr:EAL domain-containing protein [Butyrivibrio sp. FCS014]